MLVLLERFCEVVGAEVKVLDGLAYPAVCKVDLCNSLNAPDVADAVLVIGRLSSTWTR